MAYRLPPLSTMRLFEAAGRYLSFKTAAAELLVSPSAVSHGIQALEDWLGVRLFARARSGLTLTEAGSAYLPCVRDALAALAVGTEHVRRRPREAAISISVPPTFAAKWLLPRLPRFARRRPDIAISLDMRHGRVEFPRDGVDLAVRMASEPAKGLESSLLVNEQLVPVGAPGLRRGKRVPDIAAFPLIHVSSVSEDWAAWCAATGRPLPRRGSGIRCDTVQIAMEAAAQGLGIAVGRRPLVDDDLAAGRLVEFGAPAVAAKTGYWLVGTKATIAQPEARAFRAWLYEELAGAPRAEPGLVMRKPVAGDATARRST
jgi:LysR family transcriptional regulator, glycine cleavage system transcriptional activator